MRELPRVSPRSDLDVEPRQREADLRIEHDHTHRHRHHHIHQTMHEHEGDGLDYGGGAEQEVEKMYATHRDAARGYRNAGDPASTPHERDYHTDAMPIKKRPHG